jgi:outer membrane protein OmpA-like peptidoglycan-associated protein
MSGPVKKLLLLLLLWSGFGFALNEYLEQKPSDNLPVKDSTALISTENRTQSEVNERQIADSSENVALKNFEEAPIKNEIETISSDQTDENSASEMEIISQTNETPQAMSSQFVLNLDSAVLDITPNTSELIWQSNWSELVDQLSFNMRVNPNLTLEIIGHFDPSEPIAEPNLGIQRSVRVKNKLVATGLNPDRINCRGNLQRLFDKNNKVPPIIIRLSEPLSEQNESIHNQEVNKAQSQNKESSSASEKSQTTSEQNINLEPDPQLGPEKVQVQSGVRANPNFPKYNSVVYQPTFSDQGIVIDKSFLNLVPSVQQWLDLDKRNYIEIWGHTDHVGHDQDNYRLALKWANQTRSFLISKGINSERIKALSAGEQQPLYTNSNSRGREKNRRIELIFKF